MMDVQKQVNRVHLLKTLRLAHRWLYESRENWDIEEVEKEKLFKAISEVVEVMQMVNDDVEKNRQIMSDEEKREAKKLYDKWYKDYI